jgi:hypothetical protein
LRSRRRQQHNRAFIAPGERHLLLAPMADDTILETRGLTKEFRGFVAVRDVSVYLTSPP